MSLRMNQKASQQPKRSLGQNFFTNQSQAIKIAQHALSLNPKNIIEIGPGTGSFTQLFATRENLNVLCVEKDDLLFAQVKAIYPTTKVTHADFMDLNLTEYAKENGIDYSETVFYGSLPYNISKKIIEKVLRETNAMGYYFIVQKEVAEKYCSAKPDNNIIAIIANLFAKPTLLISIKPESFVPRPNVMSALIQFIPHNKKLFEGRNLSYENFVKFLHICFKQPRKTLRNNLKLLLQQKSVDATLEIFNERPENLTTEDFFKLYTTIY